MKTVRTYAELRESLANADSVGLVPTMGAFHEGHLSLMRHARSNCKTVVVSLFVNPTQFGPNEDFARYPRQEEHDRAMAESVGVDILFAPNVEEMYPSMTTSVTVSGVSELWEGAIRPGHFDGVATIVLKLLNMVRPAKAFFGLKDLQQCAVISRMVLDLNVPVELCFVETVREPSGLAMSSRNRYLTDDQRQLAALLNACLIRVADSIKFDAAAGIENIERACAVGRTWLEQNGFKVDYLAFVDFAAMNALHAFKEDGRVVAAARIGPVRLLDNVSV